MGSGYVMTAYALRALTRMSQEETKAALESLGVPFLLDVFSDCYTEDFSTRSKIDAELVRIAVTKDFERDFGKGYPFSVDVIQDNGRYKVSFFK